MERRENRTIVASAVVIVLLAVTTIVASGACAEFVPDPWEIADRQIYEDCEFFLENDVLIREGGELYLSNCTLVWSDPYAVGLELVVEPGGSLNLSDCRSSGLRTYNGDTRYRVVVYGSFSASDCTFANLTGTGNVGGIEIYSDEARMDGCLILDSDSSGIYVRNSSPRLAGNLVIGAEWGYTIDGPPESSIINEFLSGETVEIIEFIGDGSFANTGIELTPMSRIGPSSEITLKGDYLMPRESAFSPYIEGMDAPVAVHENDGVLYVANSQSVTMVLSNGTLLGEPISSFEDYEFSNILDVAVGQISSGGLDDNWLYAIDSYRREVHIDKLRPDGSGWTEILTGISKPVSVDISDDRVYVADTKKMLVILDGDGNLLDTITWELSSPSWVSATGELVYVVDTQNDDTHVDVFTLDGQWTRTIHLDIGVVTSIDVGDKIYATESTGYMYVTDLDGSNATRIYSSGLLDAVSIACGSSSKAYVVDGGAHIDVFDCGYPHDVILDIGDDGVVDWMCAGVFDGDMTLSASNICLDSILQSFVGIETAEPTSVTLRLDSNSTGRVQFSDLFIEYTQAVYFVNNSAGMGSVGILFNSTDSVYADSVDVMSNDVGVLFDASSPEVSGLRVTYSASYDMKLMNESEPSLTGAQYDSGKVLVEGCTVDSDDDLLCDTAEMVIYGTDPECQDTDSDGLTDGWEAENGGDPLDPLNTGYDSDDDLLGDFLEMVLGTNPQNADTDGDGLVDGIEHGLLMSDPTSNDTDNDGLSDSEEAEFGTNLLSIDSDADGVLDSMEVDWCVDTDGDSKINALDADSDNDDLNDSVELSIGLDMVATDSDSDGYADGAEYKFWSDVTGTRLPEYLDMYEGSTYFSWPTDWEKIGASYLVNVLYSGVISKVATYEDGLWTEYAPGDPILLSFIICPGADIRVDASGPFVLASVGYVTGDIDSDQLPNILDGDSDGDGLEDGLEISRWGSNDLDLDGLVNAIDTDSDGDCLDDGYEMDVLGTDPDSTDSDKDSLTDYEEMFIFPTYIDVSDSDMDGMSDGVEADYWTSRGLSPLSADTDGDGIVNILDFDSDNDQLPDRWEIDSGLDPMYHSCLPIAPNNFTLSSTTTHVSLCWDLPLYEGYTAVSSFSVYRRDAGSALQLIAELGRDVLEYNDSAIAPGELHYYVVAARNSYGEGAPSNEMSCLIGALPSEPTNFQAVAGQTRAFLSWSPPSFDGWMAISAYNVYMRTPTSEAIVVATLGSATLGITLYELTPSATYYYSVSAVNFYGEGLRCQELTVIPTAATQPSPPTSVVATSGIYVTLTWSPPLSDGGSNITQYNIYRSTKPGQEKLVYDTVPATWHVYYDWGIEERKTYYYKLTAVNSVDESDMSEEVSGTLVWESVPVGSYECTTEQTASPVSVSVAELSDDTVLLAESIPDPSLFLAGDIDGDGLDNGDEVYDSDGDGIVYPTDLYIYDTDGDNIPDGQEVAYWNSISEGLALSDSDHDGLVNVVDADSDNDGFSDGYEIEFMESLKADDPTGLFGPTDDFDGDGLINLLDADSDNDGLNDGAEVSQGGNFDYLQIFTNSGYPYLITQLLIPVDGNGAFLPLGGGTLTLSGAMSGGGVFYHYSVCDLDVSYVTDVDAGDLDGDGDNDLAVSSQDGFISVLYNEGNISMDVSAKVYIGGRLGGICVGRFDSDGLADIAVFNDDNDTVTILFSEAQGVFSSPRYVVVGTNPTDITTGHSDLWYPVNGDRDTIWTANFGTTTVSRLCVMSRDSVTRYDYGIPSGGMGPTHPYRVRPEFYRPLRDGYGFVTTNPNQCSCYTYVKDGDGVGWSFLYELYNDVGVHVHPSEISTGDFNGDGMIDFCFIDKSTGKMYRADCRDTTGIMFEIWWERTTYVGLDCTAVQSTYVGAVCCNTDGSLQSFGAPYYPTSFYDIATYETVPGAGSMCSADFTGDGYSDIVVGEFGPEGRIFLHTHGYPPSDVTMKMYGYSYESSTVRQEILHFQEGFNTDTVMFFNLYDVARDFIRDNYIFTDSSTDPSLKPDGYVAVRLYISSPGRGSMRIQSPDIPRILSYANPSLSLDWSYLDMFNDDSDFDGLADGYERLVLGTNPGLNDTDSDGMNDHEEYDYWQSRGIPISFNPDGDAITNLLCDSDSDNDGLRDGQELVVNADPILSDTDSDGLWDFFDLTPDKTGSSVELQWSEVYEPGMLCRDIEVNTLFHSYASAKVRDDGVLREIYANDSDVVRPMFATDYEVCSQFEESNPDLVVIDIDPWLPVSWLSDFYWEYGGDKKYEFTYCRAERTDILTVANRDDYTLPSHQEHAEVSISIAPGRDQSLIFQVKISQLDRTTYVDEHNYVMSGIRFSLLQSDDYLNTAPFYSSVAMGVPLADNCYEYELRMPAGAVVEENCRFDGDKYTIVVMMEPIWLSTVAGIQTYQPLDTSTLSFCSVIQNTPTHAFSLYVRSSDDLEVARSVLPDTIASSATGVYQWGGLRFYLCNLTAGSVFDESVLVDESVDGVIILDYKAEGIVCAESEVNWNLVPGWCEMIDTGGGPSPVFKKYTKALSKGFTFNFVPVNSWCSLDANFYYSPGTFTQTDFHLLFLTAEDKLTANGLVDLVYSEVYEYSSPVLSGLVIYSEREQIDASSCVAGCIHLSGDQYYAIRSVLESAAVGTSVAIDTCCAYMAFEEGDTAEGIYYSLKCTVPVGTTAARLVYLESRVDENILLTLKANKEIAKKIGTIGAVATASIEIVYLMTEYCQTDDDILKQQYVERSIAVGVDAAISFTVLGAISQGVWSLTIGIVSHYLPDPLTEYLCRSWGSIIVFGLTYLLTNWIPSDIASWAYDEAKFSLVDVAKARNEQEDMYVQVVVPIP